MTLTAVPATRELHHGAEGFWAYGEVTPQREDEGRRSTDASKLTFPLQLVIVIIGGIVATVGAFWVATSTLRSDVRDILTRMELQSRSESDQLKLQDERIADQKAALDEEKRQRQLMRYDFEAQIKELKELFAKERR